MARPNWEYVRVDVLLPDNPKLDGLSAAAKWTLIEMWCWCGQHLTDGYIRDAKWKQFGTPHIRTKLLERGLAKRNGAGYQMHDYLDHQRSRAEVEEIRAKRSEAGKRSAEARAKAKALAQQDAQQTGSKPATEAEAEAEADLVLADSRNQSAGRNPREVTDDDLIELIISELHQATGTLIDRPWAAKTRDYILEGRTVTDPAAYIRQAIRSEPNPKIRFLPLY